MPRAPRTKADPTPVVVEDPLADLRQDEGDTGPGAPDPLQATRDDLLKFELRGDEPDPLAAVVGQAVGAASMAWENPAGAGVFDDARASLVVDSLLAVLRGTQTLVGPEDQANARAVIIAAWHEDRTSLGFLHKGGVCGCHFLANIAVQVALPAVAVTE